MTNVTATFAPGARIGILGGGQLGRMLAVAAAELGYDCVVYEPEPDCPAGRVSGQCFTAGWDDKDSLAAFAAQIDVITFEFENVPADTLAFLESKKLIRPGLRSLQLTQDRLVEKRFIQSLGLATAPFFEVGSVDDLRQALEQVQTAAILKTRTLGYDGKGQLRLSHESDAQEAWSKMAGQACVLEGFVAFEREISVILARNAHGQIACYDVPENLHKDGILHTSTVPARIEAAVEKAAKRAASQIADALGHVGVLAVEFFVTANGNLIVNEIAPRVHNSGHWTQDGCSASQFQQHIRAVAGLPLADPIRHTEHIEMTNLIGDDVAAWNALAAQPRAFLHLYGKRIAKPSRKMGHINKLG